MKFNTLAEQYAYNLKQQKIEINANLVKLLQEWVHNYQLYVTNTLLHGNVPQPLYLYNNAILNKSITDLPEFKYKNNLHDYAFYELLVGETNVDEAHYSKSRSKYEKTEMLYDALIKANTTLTQALLLPEFNEFQEWLRKEKLTLTVSTLAPEVSFYEYPVYQICIEIAQ